MTFKDALGLDLTKYIDKKGKLSYISWANAYRLIKEADPEFQYTIHTAEDGVPLISRGKLHFVHTTCVYKGDTKDMWLPIMNHSCNAIPDPDSRDVGDSIMRCLAKNIAMFGVGLPLYIGEDIESIKGVEKSTPQITRDEMVAFINSKQNKDAIIEKHNGRKVDAKFLKQDILKNVYGELKMFSLGVQQHE